MSKDNISEDVQQIFNDDFEQAIKRGGEDYAAAYSEGQKDGYSLSQTRIEELEKEVERLNKLYLDLLDIAHKQAGRKNCIDELQLQSIKNNPPNE